MSESGSARPANGNNVEETNGISSSDKTKIAVALIALLGVVLSAMLSFFISRYQSQQSVEIHISELESKYSEKLYEKRLESYPKLYKIVSDLGKKLIDEDLTHSMLNLSLDEINKWDSEHAILLSQASIDQILYLRNVLAAFKPHGQISIADAQVTIDERRSIFEAAYKLETMLRRELGIFDIKGYHNPDIDIPYPSYLGQNSE